MQVERVQKWVMSALLVTVLFIFAGGLAILSQTVPDRNGAHAGLLVLAAVIGVCAILGARIINGASLVTPWLFLGAVPAALGWWIGGTA